jgi:protein gp37
MYTEKKRYGQTPDKVVRSKPATFKKPLKWEREVVANNQPAPLVFTCSWSDWFHEDADEWRDDAWEIVRKTPHLIYQILTKRSERIAECLPEDWGDGYPNIWLGVSVENQRWTTRIADLVRVPARVRFLSCEPLLGYLDIAKWLRKCNTCHICQGNPDICMICSACPPPKDGIDWVITGGESGPRQREMKLEWARSLRDQCVRVKIPFFLKQLGGHPNKRGGEKALLDGVRWTQIPEVNDE